MEFPVTIDSQEGFDQLVKSRLEREKTKQDELAGQVEALTAEKQGLETELTSLSARATAAEEWKQAREEQDAHAAVLAKVAEAQGVPAEALVGTNEEELTAHAEILKPLLQGAGSKPVSSIGDSPKDSPKTAEREAVRQLFGND